MVDSKEQYLDLVQVVIVALDDRGRVTFVNRRGVELLGCTEREIVGKNWFESFIPERVRDDLKGVYAQLMRGDIEPVERYENPVLVGNGEEKILSWRNTVLRDGDRIVGTLSSGEDVTAQRITQEALERSFKELTDMKTALDQAAIVATTDRTGIIDYVNDKFCEISGYAREELIGQDHRIVNSGLHPKTFFRDLWQTIMGGRVWRGEIRNRRKDGTFYWVDTTIVPFVGADGNPYRYMAIRADITARKEAEQALRNQESLAKLGQMAAVVAHEVKNPLAGIDGAVEIIGQRLPRGSDEKEIIGSIRERIGALNARVRDLLMFSRPKEPRFRPVRILPLLKDTGRLLVGDPKFVDVDVAVRGDDCAIQGDPELLRDVFFNLFLNAAQAGGTPRRIDVTVRGLDGGCRIEIRDEGAGIPGDARERVFEPFFTTKSQGTGLGLTIARQIIAAHHGSIEIEDGPAGGTAVRLTLPFERTHPEVSPGQESDSGR